MSFSGLGSTRIGFGESSWQEYLRQLRAKQAQQAASKPIDTRFAPQVPTQTSINVSRAAPPNTPGSATQVTPTVASAIQNQTQRSVDQSAVGSGGGNADNKISNDMDVRPGRFYSQYPGSSIGALAGDVGATSRAWAKAGGYTGDAYANYLSGLYQDPATMMLAMGISPGKMTNPQDKLDWEKRFFDMTSGKDKIGGNYAYLSGRDVINNVLNAKSSNQAGSLGQILNNTSLTPDQQVQNTINLLKTSLGPIIGSDALNSYVSVLGQLGQQFIDRWMKNPKQSQPFISFLRQNLGAGGGLY